MNPELYRYQQKKRKKQKLIFIIHALQGLLMSTYNFYRKVRVQSIVDNNIACSALYKTVGVALIQKLTQVKGI